MSTCNRCGNGIFIKLEELCPHCGFIYKNQ